MRYSSCSVWDGLKCGFKELSLNYEGILNSLFTLNYEDPDTGDEFHFNVGRTAVVQWSGFQATERRCIVSCEVRTAFIYVM
jgi:hypothetical protein